jgi:dCTP deaminase
MGMAMLVDRQILEALDTGDIAITPTDGLARRIQPASLDVRLGDTFAVFVRNHNGMIDPKVDTTKCWRFDTIPADGYYVVHPDELVLATTLESVELADTILARVEGKSSLGRLGVLVHATAGYIDPGWAMAPITLEISTVIGVAVKLYPGMPIAQLAFERVERATTGYAGKYVGQRGPTPSQYHRNWMGSGWT